MIRVVFLALLIASGFCDDTEEDGNDWSFDFRQISKLLKKNIQCLEKSGVPSPNTTLQLALGKGFLMEIYDTVPHLPDKERKVFKHIEYRMTKLIDKSLEAYPDDLFSIVWRSDYYIEKGYYLYKIGSVKNRGPLKKSFFDIIKESESSSHFDQCVFQLFTENGRSLEQRTCSLPCRDDVYNDNFDKLSAVQKAYYNGFQSVLNCSNFESEQAIANEAGFCTYIIREIETMLKFQTTEVFDHTRYYFLGKVNVCAPWGFKEFLSHKIIEAVVRTIDCNGCVGRHLGSDAMQVLTAQTATALGMVLRMVAEENAKIIIDVSK